MRKLKWTRKRKRKERQNMNVNVLDGPGLVDFVFGAAATVVPVVVFL